MGLFIATHVTEGPVSEITTMNLSTGWVWIVFRLSTDGTGVHLQGVFEDEEKAVACCNDETYLIGPVPLNTGFSENRMDWVGAYFPSRRQQP